MCVYIIYCAVYIIYNIYFTLCSRKLSWYVKVAKCVCVRSSSACVFYVCQLTLHAKHGVYVWSVQLLQHVSLYLARTLSLFSLALLVNNLLICVLIWTCNLLNCSCRVFECFFDYKGRAFDSYFSLTVSHFPSYRWVLVIDIIHIITIHLMERIILL